MSEYWKSTPKYWCKHCKVYVKDTKFEKSNHEASGRHQGNIKRFLRDLQRGEENKEREKERGKREVERVTKIVEGKNGGASGSGGGGGGASSSMPLPPRPQATPAQRKQQLEQLAEMGVSIPSEFRSDLAMVGDWEVVNETVVVGGEKGPDGLAMGVRKREVKEGEEEDEEERAVKRGKWMSSIKTYPGEDEDDGLDELLNKATSKGKGIERPLDIKTESTTDTMDMKTEEQNATKVEDSKHETLIKKELPEEASFLADVKTETDAPSAGGGVVFKKRKPKNIRQK